jgi:hypothetical protein
VFGAASCRGPNGQPIDYYQFTTPADGTVAAVTTSPVIDSYLTLQNPDGSLLRWDDNSYGGLDAFVVQFLPGQTYRIGVQATDAIAAGYYRLDLLYAAGERPAGCAPLATLGAGDSVEGTLSFTACQYPDDTFADIYQINLADTTVLTLRLASSDFEPYLLVLDGKGSVVDEGALVSHTFDPGTYFVVAKAFSGYTATGKYMLAVSVTQ